MRDNKLYTANEYAVGRQFKTISRRLLHSSSGIRYAGYCMAKFLLHPITRKVNQSSDTFSQLSEGLTGASTGITLFTSVTG